jgi:hypothetical protein
LPEENIMEAFLPIYQYAKQTSNINKQLYILFIYIFYFAFVLSSDYFGKLKIRSIMLPRDILIPKILYILFFALTFYILYRNRNALFRGYLSEYGGSERGPLVSISLILFSLFVIVCMAGKKFNKTFCILYFIVAFLILSMGTRLYFLSMFLSTISLIIMYGKGIKVKSFALLLVGLLVIFSSIGLLRNKDSLSLNGIIFIFFGEPFFTSYSLFSFLTLNKLPLWNFPKELIISFFNIVPTYLIPNKSEIIDSMVDIPYQYVNPLGADSLFANCMINFGLIGSIFFVIIFSFMINYTKKIIPSSYIMILGFLSFTFFRDIFSVSLVKNIFQYSMLMPFIFYCITNLICISARGMSGMTNQK